MKEGIVKFYGYCVENMSYFRNSNYDVLNESIDLSPQFLFKLIISKDIPEKYNIIIGTRVGYSNENCPFRAEVVLRGFFEVKGKKYSEEELQKIYLINSSAILFPYLRSVLTDITSKSDHGPVILPTFNFHTIIDDSKIDDIILDSSEYQEYN